MTGSLLVLNCVHQQLTTTTTCVPQGSVLGPLPFFFVYK